MSDYMEKENDEGHVSADLEEKPAGYEDVPIPQEPNPVSQPQDGPEPPARWKPGQNEVSTQQYGSWEPPQNQAGLQYPGGMGNPDEDPLAKVTGTGAIGSTRFTLKGQEVLDFESARRFMIAAYAIGCVSLFLGGILVSIVALMCAIIARNKFDKLSASRMHDEPVYKALRRSGTVVVAITTFILVLNVLAMVFLYPMVMQNMQAGDLGPLFGASPSAGVSGGNSTWG